MFTFESWFRLDPSYKRPDGYIAQVFSLAHAGEQKVGFAISNKFLRVYLDDTVFDVSYPFAEMRHEWKFVAVSYMRHFERETIVTVIIDQNMVYN
jgi:hypothetical protein